MQWIFFLVLFGWFGRYPSLCQALVTVVAPADSDAVAHVVVAVGSSPRASDVARLCSSSHHAESVEQWRTAAAAQSSGRSGSAHRLCAAAAHGGAQSGQGGRL